MRSYSKFRNSNSSETNLNLNQNSFKRVKLIYSTLLISFNHTQPMDNLHFNLEEELMLPSLSPAIIDVSRDSGDEFIVHPGDLSEIKDRFRPGGPRSDVMTDCLHGSGNSFSVPHPNEKITSPHQPHSSTLN